MCYGVYMDELEAIPIRELRNDVSQVIRRVEAGTSFDVTRHGRPVARLVPLGDDVRPGTLDDLRAVRDRDPVDFDLLDLVRMLRSDDRDVYARTEERFQP